LKKQAESILWEIAKGDAIPQGEKTIYPSVRERISALTTLGKWEGWDKPAQKAAEIIAQDLQHTHEALEDGDNPFEEVLDEEEDTDDTDTEAIAVSAEESPPTCIPIAKPTVKKGLIKKALAQKDLLAFTQYTLPYFAPAAFHHSYYRQLTEFAMGRIQKLMITMPPQHGKSEGATRRLPAFLLGRNPECRIAIVSYNTTKARKFNRELQRILQEESYQQLFPQTFLAGGAPHGMRSNHRAYARNADECEIVGHRGSFKTLGVGGALTGEPVDVLIMDDLYKDALSAWSPTIRQNIADWYDTVATTRLHNDSQQLLVFTRWHEDDLAGRLLEQEGHYDAQNNPLGWQVISFPAIQNVPPSPKDPREIGAPLWPQRHDLPNLLSLKERNPQVFESLYQQNPQPNEGLLYQEFAVYESAPVYAPVVAYIDVADSGNDYLCALIYKEADEGNYILEVLYTQEPMERTECLLSDLLMRHQVERCHIESNNGGHYFSQNIEELSRNMGNTLTRFLPFHQRENKAARIFACSTSVQRMTLMPMDWKERFPAFAHDLIGYLRTGGNAHDDAPDALTGAIECRQPKRKIPLSELLQW